MTVVPAVAGSGFGSSPTTASALPPAHRRLDVQGLRAVAVLLVVLYHAGLPVPGGFVGVDVFFVISGYVITAMLQREWSEHGRLAFGRFYLRRFLRLTPALALTVSVVAALSVLLQNPYGAQQTTARTGLGAMLLSANYVIGHASGDYFAEGALTNPLLHTWSLSVEEQFYLVFPALLVVGWLLVRGRRRSAPVVVVSAIAVGSFALSMAWSYGSPLLSGLTDFFGGAPSFAYYASLTRAWEFAAGALLVLVPAASRLAGRHVAEVLGLTGGVALVASALLINDSQPFPGVVALLPVAGTMLVIAAGAAGPNAASRALSTRTMVWIGDRSYSWYLWHWPLIVFTALLFPQQPLLLVVAAAASLAPSVLSYRFVEQPLRRYRPRTRPRAAAVAAVTVGIPLALCGGLLAGANRGWGLVPDSPAAPTYPSDGSSLAAGIAAPEPTTTDAASPTSGQDGDEVAGGEGGSLRSQHVLVRAGCVNTDLEPERCRFGPADPAGTVLLAGDSQAYALADGVIDAATRLGYDTVATSHTGCPFLARESSGVHNHPCATWQQEIIDFARSSHPAAVVIANRAGGYVRTGKDWRTVARDDGSAARSDEEARALYEEGLTPIVTLLEREGIPVVIVASVPEMVGYTNRTSLLGSSLGGGFTVDRAAVEADRAPALAVESALATSLPGVVLYDPNPDLCDDTTCAAERDGTPVYQDQYHLAVPGSLRLSDGLASAMRTAIDEGTPPGGADH